jgi:inner membrane protein
MQGRNHVALALAVPLAGAIVGGPLPGSAAAWGGLIVGSLAPDIDGGGSVAYWGNWLPRPITPGPVRALLNGVGKTTSDVIRSAFGHRQAFHWPTWGVIIIALGLVLGLDWLLWFGAGYILHILGDSLTKSGVPLFGPLITKDISFSPMRTGGVTETLFGAGLWLFVGWQVWERLPSAGWLVQLLYRFGGQFL